METSVGQWVVRSDLDQTAEFYSNLTRADHGFTCECNSCKNFAATLEYAFPESFREIAGEMGIDVSKYVMLDHFSPDEAGLYFTSGEFFLPGEIVAGGDLWKDQRKGKGQNWAELSDSFSVGFTAVLSSPDVAYDPVNFICLRFQTRVPWVLDAPEPTWSAQ